MLITGLTATIFSTMYYLKNGKLKLVDRTNILKSRIVSAIKNRLGIRGNQIKQFLLVGFVLIIVFVFFIGVIFYKKHH